MHVGIRGSIRVAPLVVGFRCTHRIKMRSMLLPCVPTVACMVIGRLAVRAVALGGRVSRRVLWKRRPWVMMGPSGFIRRVC